MEYKWRGVKTLVWMSYRIFDPGRLGGQGVSSQKQAKSEPGGEWCESIANTCKHARMMEYKWRGAKTLVWMSYRRVDPGRLGGKGVSSQKQAKSEPGGELCESIANTCKHARMMEYKWTGAKTLVWASVASSRTRIE
jgi:hypothetical protein